jgi:outer membrane protein assembly complex protein YaeT
VRSAPRGSAASVRAALVGFAVPLVLALAGGPVAPAHAAEDDLIGALKRVEAVRLEGNRAVSGGTLRKVLRTSGSDFLGLRGQPLFRPDFLRSDIVAIRTVYTRRGYLNAQATAAADSGSKPGRVVVTFRIVEGERFLVRSVTVDSSSQFPPDQLRRSLVLREGKAFDPVQVVLDREAIGALYAERGHFPTITTSVDTSSSAVDIRFAVHEGPAYRIGDIDVEGVQRVDTSAVRREILLAPGDLYRRNRLVESSERLNGSGLFTSVEIEPEAPDTLTRTVGLDVRVRERLPRRIEGGIGTGTVENIRVSGLWGHRNLSGDGKSLTATVSAGSNGEEIRSKAELAFVEPWLLGRRTRGRVAVSVERDFDEYAERTYIQEAVGLQFGISRDYFSSRSRISLVLDNTWTRLAKVIKDSETDTTEFRLAPYLPRLTLAYDQDRRDDPLHPRRGAINNLRVELAGVLEQDTGRYAKFEALSGIHLPLGTSTSLGFRLRGGVIRPVGGGPGGAAGTLSRVPATDRYYVGGTSTVRGYGENGIDAGGEGGVLLGVANVELRRDLKGPLGALLFVDGGNVWSDPRRVRIDGVFGTNGVDGSVGLDDVHWSYGVGLNLRTPVGPLRLDYARRLRIDESDVLAGLPPERDAFHFAIGFMF